MLRFGVATDDATSPGALQYRAVRAATAGEVDTAAKVQARVNDVLYDWGRYPTSVSATGLTPGNTYWFAVAVRDAAGNTALYPPASVTTTHNTAPVPSGPVSLSALSSMDVVLTWPPAFDDAPASSLRYKVVRVQIVHTNMIAARWRCPDQHTRFRIFK